MANLQDTATNQGTERRKPATKKTWEDLWLVQVDENTYRVESRSLTSELFPYHVVYWNYSLNDWICPCRNFQYNWGDCPHVKRVNWEIRQRKEAALQAPVSVGLEPLVYPEVGNKCFVPHVYEHDLSDNKLVQIFG